MSMDSDDFVKSLRRLEEMAKGRAGRTPVSPGDGAMLKEGLRLYEAGAAHRQSTENLAWLTWLDTNFRHVITLAILSGLKPPDQSEEEEKPKDVKREGTHDWWPEDVG